VLEAMLDAVLPQLLSKSLGGRVVEILGEAADTIETSVTITCAPESEKLLRELVADVIKFPVVVEAEPTLTASQAIMHLNEGQTSIDLDATLEAVRDCINTFFEVPEEKEVAHA
jgi:flagellar assembly protein FliH